MRKPFRYFKTSTEILRLGLMMYVRFPLSLRQFEGKGIRHTYIRPNTPQLNGKVERSRRSDGQESHQLLSYKGDVDKGDVDLEAKLA